MAIRIEGKLLAAQVKERVAAGVKELKEKGIEPCLAVIMVGENPASQVYVKGKVKDCAECGIKSLEIHLPAETTQEELLQKLRGIFLYSLHDEKVARFRKMMI